MWNLETAWVVTLTHGFKVWSSMKGDDTWALSSSSSSEKGRLSMSRLKERQQHASIERKGRSVERGLNSRQHQDSLYWWWRQHYHFAKRNLGNCSLSLSLSLSVQEPAFEIDSPKCKTLSLKRPSEGDPNAEFSLKRWSERDPNTIPLRLPLVQEQFQIEPHAADSTTSRGP